MGDNKQIILGWMVSGSETETVFVYVELLIVVGILFHLLSTRISIDEFILTFKGQVEEVD